MKCDNQWNKKEKHSINELYGNCREKKNGGAFVGVDSNPNHVLSMDSVLSLTGSLNSPINLVRPEKKYLSDIDHGGFKMCSTFLEFLPSKDESYISPLECRPTLLALACNPQNTVEVMLGNCKARSEKGRATSAGLLWICVLGKPVILSGIQLAP